LITGGLLSIQTPVGYALAASGKMWTNFMMTFGWGLIFIITTLLLLEFGSLGLAVARAVSYIVLVTGTFWFVFWASAGQENQT
jgi:O-antigen/teichoic acid export membrane protein